MASFPKPYVIRITGMMGSGKSYLGNMIKEKLGNDVLVCDIDDYYKSVFLKYYKKNKIPSNEEQDTEVSSLLYKDIEKTNARLVVILTVTTQVGGHNFYIKIDDLNTAYRRFMEREYQKIYKNKSIIDKIIKETPNPNFINRNIIENLILAPRYDFEEYKKMYNNNLKEMKERKFIVATQDVILKNIINLYDLLVKYSDSSLSRTEEYIRGRKELKKLKVRALKSR